MPKPIESLQVLVSPFSWFHTEESRDFPHNVRLAHISLRSLSLYHDPADPGARLDVLCTLSSSLIEAMGADRG